MADENQSARYPQKSGGQISKAGMNLEKRTRYRRAMRALRFVLCPLMRKGQGPKADTDPDPGPSFHEP